MNNMKKSLFELAITFDNLIPLTLKFLVSN